MIFYKAAAPKGQKKTCINKPRPSAYDYKCSCCGETCFYDGRCGDGPILTCGCNGHANPQANYSDSRI